MVIAGTNFGKKLKGSSKKYDIFYNCDSSWFHLWVDGQSSYIHIREQLRSKELKYFYLVMLILVKNRG